MQKSYDSAIRAASSEPCESPPGTGRNSVSPLGGSPRSASTFSMPASCISFEDRVQLVARVADAGEVLHRLDAQARS